MFSEAIRYIDEELVGKKKIPYLDVCVHKDHEEVFRYRAGATGKKFDGTEKLYMYSCTKPVTVACAMRLVEEGRLSPDDPVSKYLPAYAGAFVLDGNGEKKTVGDRMLVSHLLTMSAGLDYERGKAPIKSFAKEHPSAGTVDVVNTFILSPLVFEPGEKFLYSLCHDVLGAVIEVASGMRFSEYAEKVIFSPLGMKDTTLRPRNKAPELFESYNARGMVKVGREAYDGFIVTDEYESGGAGLVSTVSDYARFADTLACGVSRDGYRLLKPETIELMRRVRFSRTDVKNEFTCVQGNDYGYGFGVRVRTTPHTCGIPVGEFGWDGAAGSYLMVDTEHGISVVMGMNLLSWPLVFTGEHLNITERIYKELI